MIHAAHFRLELEAKVTEAMVLVDAAAEQNLAQLGERLRREGWSEDRVSAAVEGAREYNADARQGTVEQVRQAIYGLAEIAIDKIIGPSREVH